MHYDRGMKHRLWFFFFSISLVTHAVIFFSNVRKSQRVHINDSVGIDIQIKALKKGHPKTLEKPKALVKRPNIIEKNHEKISTHNQQEVVTAKTFDNQILDFKAPLYPRAARRIGASGRVTVAISINVAGLVTDVRILEGAKFNAFNEVVLESAKHWRFKSQRKPMTFTKVVNFSME